MSLWASACLCDGQVPFFVERIFYGRQKEISPNGKQNPRRLDAAQVQPVLGAKQATDESYWPASTTYHRIPENGNFRDTRLAFSSPKVL